MSMHSLPEHGVRDFLVLSNPTLVVSVLFLGMGGEIFLDLNTFKTFCSQSTVSLLWR